MKASPPIRVWTECAKKKKKKEKEKKKKPTKQNKNSVVFRWQQMVSVCPKHGPHSLP
jgi:hypothetical protein